MLFTAINTNIDRVTIYVADARNRTSALISSNLLPLLGGISLTTNQSRGPAETAFASRLRSSGTPAAKVFTPGASRWTRVTTLSIRLSCNSDPVTGVRKANGKLRLDSVRFGLPSSIRLVVLVSVNRRAIENTVARTGLVESVQCESATAS